MKYCLPYYTSLAILLFNFCINGLNASAFTQKQNNILNYFLLDDQYTKNDGKPVAYEILSMCHPNAVYKESSISVYENEIVYLTIFWDGIGKSTKNKTILKFTINENYTLASVYIAYDDSPFKGFLSIEFLKDMILELSKSNSKNEQEDANLFDQMLNEIIKNIESMKGDELFNQIMRLRWFAVKMPKALKKFSD